ncbi:SDR family NAD(P)-dependent oxidoreductase [Mucilaginibacter sp. 21P]|uniref:SDR family NAD(P)-dependent oxidoreductase n=1 Tax=Mucilaginibacter sp. 21P TaxID=2778902 RepID=UPI001C5A2FC0|nr:SDR family NAD(P)-dependent oxidoreductase [Mucilaginibacter sp. 21P]QXV63707.1 SDR family NAD(P)-dependent oxidoreductase [Mucilaginibacter sp. 21P]
MKNILITGANKGIGFETARQLAQQGHRIFMGSRDADKGKKAVAELNEQGLNVELLIINISDSQSVKQAREQLEQRVKALDVLINNAGIAGGMPQDFASVSIENVRQIFDTNFFGTVQTTQEFLPLLKRSEDAQIINVSSEVGSITLRTASDRNLNRDQYKLMAPRKQRLMLLR